MPVFLLKRGMFDSLHREEGGGEWFIPVTEERAYALEVASDELLK